METNCFQWAKIIVNLQLCLGKVTCSWTSTETEIALSWHADEHTGRKIALAVLQLPLLSINLLPHFVSSFSYKMEVPATIPPCVLLRCLLLIQLSGSISWTPMKTYSRRKSSSLIGESLLLTCGVWALAHCLLEREGFESTKERSYLRVPLAQLSLFCCKEQYDDLWEEHIFFMSSPPLPLGIRMMILKGSNKSILVMILYAL